VEVIILVAVMGLLTAIALPPLGRMRTTAALQSGRAQVTGALSLAQSTGVRWGRTARVRIDTLEDALTLEVDTGSAGFSSAPMLVRAYRLGAELGLELESDRGAICYNARGVATTASGCPATGARLILRSGDRSDTVSVNAAGRVWR
jgi:type II secretory pathway pseudopilin PulG